MINQQKLEGARPIGYLQNMVELNSGPPKKTNPSGGREKHLNPRHLDYKSSARPLSHPCLLLYDAESITFSHYNVKFPPIRQFALCNVRECFLNYKFSGSHVLAMCYNGWIMSRLSLV